MRILRSFLLFTLSSVMLGQGADRVPAPGVLVPHPFTDGSVTFSIPFRSNIQNPLARDIEATPAPALAVAEPNALCYALRSYRFRRERPESDTTRYSGASTCLPSSSVHTKTALSRSH